MTTTNTMNESDRVRRNTSAEVQARIDTRIENNIRFYATQSEDIISRRIRELEAEWSVERWIETNASALAFTGTVLGLTVNRKWFALPLIVTGFLFQHAIQGWCPPVPALRRMGVRTRGEIDREKFAMKILRGDFKKVKLNPQPQLAHEVHEAVTAA
jgi:hypothetical protein